MDAGGKRLRFFAVPNEILDYPRCLRDCPRANYPALRRQRGKKEDEYRAGVCAYVHSARGGNPREFHISLGDLGLVLNENIGAALARRP